MALECLIGKFEDKGIRIKDYLVAQEDHKDGGKHLHAYISLDKKINCRDPRGFDITDDDGVEYHGHYAGARSDADVIKYCHKEGNYISSMSDDEIEAKIASRKSKHGVLGELIRKDGVTADVIKKYPELLTKDIGRI